MCLGALIAAQIQSAVGLNTINKATVIIVRIKLDTD